MKEPLAFPVDDGFCTVLPAAIDDTAEIASVLNEATRALLQKGIAQWRYPWPEEQIGREICRGNVYKVLDHGKTVGTFSVKCVKECGFTSVESDGWYLYRLALLPAYQSRGLGKMLMRILCRAADEADRALYLDCWAGNGHLKAFYAENFENCGDFNEENYKITLFKHKI